jgi:hypothetical protein
MKKYIVWTGKMDTLGTLWPSCSLGTADTIEEAAEKGREWQQRVHRSYPGRKAGPCVITTYGAQKIVGAVPENRYSAGVA